MSRLFRFGLSSLIPVRPTGYFAVFLLARKMTAATAAITTTTIPTNTVGGMLKDADGEELEEPTVTWVVFECERDPLVAVTLTE